MISTIACAAIVLMGAFYALFFALGRLHSNRFMALIALGSYGLLAIAVYVLIRSLDLNGFWIVVTSVMLIGYFVAPRAIWKLCVGTHANETASTESRTMQ
jgi:hypothetical protein